MDMNNVKCGYLTKKTPEIQGSFMRPKLPK